MAHKSVQINAIAFDFHLENVSQKCDFLKGSLVVVSTRFRAVPLGVLTRDPDLPSLTSSTERAIFLSRARLVGSDSSESSRGSVKLLVLFSNASQPKK